MESISLGFEIHGRGVGGGSAEEKGDIMELSQKRPNRRRRPPRKEMQSPQPPAKLIFPAYIFWIAFSLCAAILTGSGFCLPYWIQGTYRQFEITFGPFRQCSFSRTTSSEVMPVCSRYSTLADINVYPWKITTVLMFSAVLLSFLIAFTLLFACCIPYSMKYTNARIMTLLQLNTVLLVIAASAAFPLGWSDPEFRKVCGPQAKPYEIGTCQLSLSTYLIAIGQLASLFAYGCGLCSVVHLRRQQQQHSVAYNSLLRLN